MMAWTVLLLQREVLIELFDMEADGHASFCGLGCCSDAAGGI